MLKKIITVSAIALSSVLLFNVNNNKVAATSAIETKSIVDTYYQDVNTSLKGEAFINNLTPIINAGFKSHSYDAAKKILAESDRDPNNSNKVICFYTGDSLSEGQWNREHVWAKSHGFPTKSFNAYSDAHHLRPTLVKINSTRSNLDFGEVPGGSTDGKGNYWSKNAFEPRDEVKGDVARIMFYMVTKYNNVNNLKLELTNNVPTSGSTGHGKFGHLDTLIKWHYQDPVSDFERNRNEVVYGYQKNRNPYIDHPEYVDLAFNTSGGNVEVDQTKVDAVVNQIKSIPTEITLDLKGMIYDIKAKYDALNYKEKALVTNYSKLESAINKIKELESGTTPDPDKPVIPETGDVTSIDFNSVGNYGYTENVDLNASGYNFYANAAWAAPNDFRVGHNKKNLKIDSKYGFECNSDVAVLESKFSVENINRVTIDIKGVFGNKEKILNLDILVGNGNTYTVAKKGLSVSENSTVDVTFDTLQSGNLVFVFSGAEKPRAVISKIDIYKAKQQEIVDVNPIRDVKAQSSVRFSVENSIFTSAGLRLGGKFNKELFAGSSDFGIITVKTSDLKNKTINDLAKDKTLEELKSSFTTNNIKYLVSSSFMSKAEIGNDYQFALVITNILEMTKEDLSYVVYMVKDGKLYLSLQNTTSFYKTISATSKLTTLTEKEKILLDFALKTL